MYMCLYVVSQLLYIIISTTPFLRSCFYNKHSSYCHVTVCSSFIDCPWLLQPISLVNYMTEIGVYPGYSSALIVLSANLSVLVNSIYLSRISRIDKQLLLARFLILVLCIAGFTILSYCYAVIIIVYYSASSLISFIDCPWLLQPISLVNYMTEIGVYPGYSSALIVLSANLSVLVNSIYLSRINRMDKQANFSSV